MEKVDQQLREKICVEVIEKDRTVKSLVGKDGDEED